MLAARSRRTIGAEPLERGEVERTTIVVVDRVGEDWNFKVH